MRWTIICPYPLDSLGRRPDRMREEVIIDERSLIPVSQDGMPRSRRRIFDHSDFEALLQEFPQMRFHAHVREHATENHLLQRRFRS